MNRPLQPALVGAAFAAALLACPSPAPTPDAGEVDAGVVLPGCDSPEDCKVAGFAAVCRAGQCRADVPCADDVECGLGESCVGSRCTFTGCLSDADCAVGRCRTDVFQCTECGQNADCPKDRPVCQAASLKCVQCQSDADCERRGASYCDAAEGACVYCLKNEHCPNGLQCGPGGRCYGAQKHQSCDERVECDLGLICVNSGGASTCRQGCSLYSPTCPNGEICLKLTFSMSNSLVFDRGEPLGVCSPPFPGLKGYREPCVKSTQGSNCQPNLECVPESATSGRCRAFCNPNQQTCPAGEICHSFPGDYFGHRYGLCYPDNGYGERCQSDAQCRSGLACAPGDDPSSFSRLSTFCHFQVGPAPALAPCMSPPPLPDGGAQPPDRYCRSGACRGDSTFSTPNFFCYGACATDADCSVAGRQGVCDATFSFPGTNVTGTVRGCRPSCRNPAGCEEYGPGFTCRVRLDVRNFEAKLVQACAPSSATAALGEPCARDSDCRSGYCVLEDGRGVQRAGFCSHPCEQASDCSSTGLDGGTDAGVGNVTGAIACDNVSLLAWRGFDGVPNTADDEHVTASHCVGRTCGTDADCGGQGLCVPDTSATDPLGRLILRCRPPHRTGTKAGGDACAVDAECLSGACVQLQPPSTGTGRVCFQACDADGGTAQACPASTTCRPLGARIVTANGTLQNLTACVP